MQKWEIFQGSINCFDLQLLVLPTIHISGQFPTTGARFNFCKPAGGNLEPN